MDKNERRKKIVSLVNEQKSITITQISEILYISEDTVRRDLDKLSKLKLIRRVRGGAEVYKSVDIVDANPHKDPKIESNKLTIAKYAATKIEDNDVIFIYEGSTTLYLIEHIKEVNNLTIYTNSIIHAYNLIRLRAQGNFTGKIFCIGGEVSQTTISTYGNYAISQLKNIYFDKCFFSTTSLNTKGLFYFDNEAGALLNKLLLHSTFNYYLIDSSKFSTVSTYLVSPYEHQLFLITDENPPEEISSLLDDSNSFIEII